MESTPTAVAPPAPGAVIASVAYATGKRIGDVPLDDVSEVLKQPNTFVWIGLYEPDESLLRKVQEEFGLHDLAVEDALSAHQRPKIERYENSLFAVLRTAQLAEPRIPEECHVEYGETHIFLGRNYVITVRHGNATSYAAVRTRAESRPKLLKQGPAFVVYAVMDFIVDQYFPIVDALEGELQHLEERHLQRAVQSRNHDAHLQAPPRSAGVETGRVAGDRDDAPPSRAEDDLIPAATRPYFRDVHDHSLRINEMNDSVRDLLGTALEAHLSLISVSQNEDTRRLAAWAAIIAVPTMVAGIYGMNFDFMPELRWVFGYPLVLGVTIAICLTLYTRFKKSHWL